MNTHPAHRVHVLRDLHRRALLSRPLRDDLVTSDRCHWYAQSRLMAPTLRALADMLEDRTAAGLEPAAFSAETFNRVARALAPLLDPEEAMNPDAATAMVIGVTAHAVTYMEAALTLMAYVLAEATGDA